MQNNSNNNNINDLRQMLFNTMEGVLNGQISIEQADTVGKLAQVVVNTAKSETDFLKLVTDPGNRKAAGTGFIDANIGQLTLQTAETK